MKDLLISEWVTKVKPDVNIVEDNPHPSHKVHLGMVCWWGLVHLVPSPKYKTSILMSGSMLYTHTHTQNNANLTHQTSEWKKIIGRRKLLTHAQVDQKRTKQG